MQLILLILISFMTSVIVYCKNLNEFDISSLSQTLIQSNISTTTYRPFYPDTFSPGAIAGVAVVLNIFIQSTSCTLPNNIQNLELDDITSLSDQFPSLIDKFKMTVLRLQCPKGWKRLGGSCYYFSNVKSKSSLVNYTCQDLHSNHSNLMQIRNAVELFYAAHVLARNNLSSLMIDIDANILKGKNISEMLKTDQDRWKRMKEQFSKIRVKYQNLTKNIRNQLNSAGIRILRRSSRKYKLNNTTNDNDEYTYDDLNSLDEIDELEQIDDIRHMCDDIHWNVLNIINNSTTYILTTYYVSDKIICSLNDIDPHIEYHHVCEYVLDLCFANIVCGKHGRCLNTLAGFKCSCSFLYGGLLCEKISRQGKQILISIVVIIILYLPIAQLRQWIVDLLDRKSRKKFKPIEKKVDESNDQPQLSKISLPLSSSKKSDLSRVILLRIFCIIILLVLYIILVITYERLFNPVPQLEIPVNFTFHLNSKCKHISNNEIEYIIFASFAFILILIFSGTIKRKKRCVKVCNGRFGLLSPMNPFCTRNRCETAVTFGIIAFEVLRIFEGLIFSFDHTSTDGVLINLFKRIATIILIGLQYYPILASLHLQNIIARLFACIYITFTIIYTVVREVLCIGHLPLLEPYATLEEKLRIELDQWVLFHSLIKNIPHFYLLSYIGAELYVRLIYDSIYIPLKNRQKIGFISDKETNDFEFSKIYLRKLLRTKSCSFQTSNNKDSMKDAPQQNLLSRPISSPNENRNSFSVLPSPSIIREAIVVGEQVSPGSTICVTNNKQDKINQSCFQKFLNYIYIWDEDFRFTTMITCTNTVAFVFLYYLICTFIFRYISRTTWPITFLKSYIESSAKIELETLPFKSEIIFSAIFTGILYGIQLLLGMKKYRYDKKMLYKGEKEKKKNSEESLIASISAHYSGFLIGYMAWGFVICFHLILLISIALRMFYLQTPHIVILLNIIVPIIIIYLLRRVTMKLSGDFFLIRRRNKTNNEKPKSDNPVTYAIFAYFMFFSDCFLGIASCIVRLIKALLVNLLFIARLDYNFLGSPLDDHDVGYETYKSYLRMELVYTHPIKLAFCALCLDAVDKRPITYYDDECCIIVDDVNPYEEPIKKRFQQKRTKSYKRKNKNHDSIQNNNDDTYELCLRRIPETSSRLQECDSSTNEIHKNDPIIVNDHTINDKKVLSISENLSTVRRNSKQQQQSQMSETSKLRSKQDETDDEDGGPKPKSYSTIAKIIPQQQPSLQSSKIITNNLKDEDEDEDGNMNTKIKKEQKQKVQKTNSKKKKQSIILDDDDEPILKPKKSTKETKPKKQSMFVQCFHNPDEDDGVPIRKKLDISNKQDKNSGELTVVNLTSNDNQTKTTNKNDYDVISMEEEHPVETTTTNSSPLNTNTQKSFTNKIYFLRTTSYQEAQQRSPPTISQRPNNLFSSYDQSNTNDCKSHYSEITNEIVQTGINNLVSLINHSNSTTNKEQLHGKTARNRWYIAYSIIHNRWLSNYRKKYLELEKLRLEENNQLKQQSMIPTNNIKSETLQTRRLKAKTKTLSEIQPPVVLRLLPISSIDDNSTKQNIPIYSPINQQTKILYSESMEQTSTIKVLQRENINSSSVYTQTTHHRHVQKWHVNE